MSDTQNRTVGEWGQVTIPKAIREEVAIRGGHEVAVHEEEGKIVIEKAITREVLAEGYRQRAERDREVAAELRSTSREADEHLGDAPDW